MRIIKTLPATLAFVLFAAHGAQAMPISFTDVFNPTDVFFDGQSGVACTGNSTLDTTSASTCESLTWTQTLSGYDSATDTLTSGTLTLTGYNDALNNNQTFTFSADLLPFNGSVIDTSTIGSPQSFQFTILSELSDGVVHLTLTSQNGNHTFYLAQSQLDAAGTSTVGTLAALDPTSVPEPGSMLLVGTGVVAWARRRFRQTRVK